MFTTKRPSTIPKSIKTDFSKALDRVNYQISKRFSLNRLHTINEGHLAVGNLHGFLPCTPIGVLELIKKSGVQIEGADVVVLGRSKIVGTPAAELLKWHHATVTICHSKTRNLKQKVDFYYFILQIYLQYK